MRGRRGSGRQSSDRSRHRPADARSPAAESGARVRAILERLFASGARVAEVARVLGVRSIDVARWRRGQPIAAYRRTDLEARIAALEVVTDPDTGERRLEEKERS